MTEEGERVRGFARELAEALADVAGGSLVGVYLHGSVVLGDWSAQTSDVDVLVVVHNGLSSTLTRQVAVVLCAIRDCPGAGLEASVVEAGAAAAPASPWPFLVHMTTASGDHKTVWPTPGRGDADLILHYTVTREWGWAAYGPDPHTVFGSVSEGAVVTQLAEELRWAVSHASASYAILNACRALRYRDERVVCSKTDGGTWALAQHIEPALVQRALDDRRRGFVTPITKTGAEWVLAVAEDLSP